MTRFDEQMERGLYERWRDCDCEIEAAKSLSQVVKDELSSRGLPCYYYGDRSAKTVVVNLNPGMVANKCDEQWMDKKFDEIKKLPFGEFIKWYHDEQRNFALSPEYKTDPFDVKQAAFLTPWEDNGIGLIENPDWSIQESRDIDARRVLSNKLQLELIPYASAKFAIDTKHINLLFPYVDTLLEEIFSCDRKYIIFASAVFESIFKHYNKWDERKGSFKLLEPHTFPLKNRNGKCRVVEISYKGNTHYALIANTFPSQALGRAYELMQKYGAECYLEYVNKTTK